MTTPLLHDYCTTTGALPYDYRGEWNGMEWKGREGAKACRPPLRSGCHRKPLKPTHCPQPTNSSQLANYRPRAQKGES